MTDWKPKRTLQECDRIITAPGSIHELETRVVDGRVQRVYKNMWPSLRAFWLWACEEHKDKTFIVYGSERHTYSQALARSTKAAHMLRVVHGVHKGDRVAIASRNYPEYMVVFWACHLIGAVPVLVNAWLPQDGLVFCIGHTQSKVLIVDPERADVLAPVVKQLSKNGTTTILVLEDDNKTWPGMKSWTGSLQECKDEGESILKENIEILPEDKATIFFTSGTTGRPKGVLSTQRQYLTNILNVMVASMRSILRDGEDLAPPPPGPQGGVLISVPFFHVTGTSSQAMGAIAVGNKIVLMRSWNPKEAVRLIKAENVVSAGGVPSMVADLLEIGGFSLDVLSFGGAPASKMLPASISKIAKGAKAAQGYGATETNSVAVAMAGNDQILRPTSCGLPTLVNDLLIVNPGTLVEAPTGEVGEVWIRGPNVMECYWNDPAATDKAITKDGWYRTGDLGYLDDEGFLYIKDRLKDIIIRGGENIDSVSVENALYEESGVLEAAAVGVPDQRLGELVTAVVTIKQGYAGKVTEKSLIDFVRGRLPRFAVPVMVIVQTTEMEHTPSGKIKKGTLRDIVRKEWEKRQSTGAKSRL